MTTATPCLPCVTTWTIRQTFTSVSIASRPRMVIISGITIVEPLLNAMKMEKHFFAAGIMFDVTDKKNDEFLLKEENRSLSIEVYTDPLTRISNRRALQDELEQLVNPHIRIQRPLSIILFDIDNFKQFNDDYGHLAGDKVLKSVANELNQSIRGFDTLGRYGGEEFLIILPNTNLDKALRAAERARQSIETLVIDGLPKVTVSGGVVQREEDESIETMIDRADHKLYQAKNQGRNRVC